MMVSRRDIGCVSYIQYNENDAFINELSALENKEKGIRSFKRTTLGVTISDVVDENLKPIISFIKKDNILIFSEMSILIEDIILNKNKNNWANTIVLTNKKDNYTVYFNNNSTLSTAEITCQNKENTQPWLQLLEPESMSLQDSEIIGNFETKYNQNSQMSELFEGQKNGTIDCFDKIPVAINYLLHFSFNNFEKIALKIQNKRDDAFKKEHKNLLKILENSAFYKNVASELALVGLASTQENNVKSVLLVKNIQKKTISNFLENTSLNNQKLATEIEKFGNYTIKKVNYTHFIKVAFGEVFHQFEKTYITDIDEYTVFCNDLESLHNYLLMVTNKQVWSNSSSKLAILKILKPANCTSIFQANEGWNNMIGLFKPEWQNTVDQSLSVTKNSTWIAQSFEINGKLEGYFMPVLPIGEKQKSANNFTKSNNLTLKDTIIGKQTIASECIIYQNNHSELILLKNNKKIDRFELKDKIISDLNPLSKNNNNLLIGLTNKKIILLDISTKHLKCKKINFSNALKFKHFIVLENSNKKCTILNNNGEIVVINKENNTLIETSLIKKKINFPSEQININGERYTPILSNNGILDILSSNKTSLQNFPITLKGVFENSVVLDKNGNSFIISALSNTGILYTVNLTGKIQEQKQLTRQKTADKFSILKSPNGNDWVINRQNDYTISIINPKEKEFCIINDLKEKYKKIAYYDLGNSTKLLVVQVKNYYFFYTLNGSIIGVEGLKSDFQPTLQLDEKKRILKVFTQSKNDLMEWSIKLSFNAI